MQNMVFYHLKGGLSQAKRMPFANSPEASENCKQNPFGRNKP